MRQATTTAKTGFFTTILQHLGLVSMDAPVKPNPAFIMASDNDIMHFVDYQDDAGSLNQEIRRAWKFHAAVKDNDPKGREDVLHYVRTMEAFRASWGVQQQTALRKITADHGGVLYEFSYYSATNKLVGHSRLYVAI